MRTVLMVFGIIAGILALLAFSAGMTGGTDIQLIAAGVFGTMSAVCFGFWTISKPKDSPMSLARELLKQWDTIDVPTRERLAKTLILKIHSASPENELSSLEGPALRSRLLQLTGETNR